MKEKLLVVVLADAMVVVVTTTSSSQSKWNDILRSPRKVEATMKFCQKEGNDAVVDASSQWMDTQKIQGNDRKANLQYFFGN